MLVRSPRVCTSQQPKEKPRSPSAAHSSILWCASGPAEEGYIGPYLLRWFLADSEACRLMPVEAASLMMATSLRPDMKASRSRTTGRREYSRRSAQYRLPDTSQVSAHSAPDPGPPLTVE